MEMYFINEFLINLEPTTKMWADILIIKLPTLQGLGRCFKVELLMGEQKLVFTWVRTLEARTPNSVGESSLTIILLLSCGQNSCRVSLLVLK